MKNLLFVPVVCLALASMTGCTVHTTPVYAEASYQPVYYEGYVVDYDHEGVPIYYIDNRIHYVPHTYVGYHQLVVHYRKHDRGYRKWRSSHPRDHGPRHRPDSHRRDDHRRRGR